MSRSALISVPSLGGLVGLRLDVVRQHLGEALDLLVALGETVTQVRLLAFEFVRDEATSSSSWRMRRRSAQFVAPIRCDSMCTSLNAFCTNLSDDSVWVKIAQ